LKADSGNSAKNRWYKRLAIEVGFSLPTIQVIRTLYHLLEYREKPLVIRCENGSEFISREFVRWATEPSIRIEYIQPGKPPLMAT